MLTDTRPQRRTPHRAVARTIRSGAALLGASLLFAAAGEAAERPSPIDQSTLLTGASLREESLTARLTCNRDGVLIVQNATSRARLGSGTFTCRHGHGRKTVRLRTNGARLSGSGLQISVDPNGRQARRVIDVLDVAKPERHATPVLADASSGATWSRAKASVYLGHSFYGSALYVSPNNSETFGYPFDTMVWWQSMVNTYDPATGAYGWKIGPWDLHRAGTTGTNTGPGQPWYINRIWMRPAMRTYPTYEWNYVNLATYIFTSRDSAGNTLQVDPGGWVKYSK